MKKNLGKNKRYIVLFPLLFLCFGIIFYGKQIESFVTFPYTRYQKITWTKPFELTAQDGKKTYAVYLDKKVERTIFYFHGNGENLESIQDDLLYISNSFDANVLCFDYPGYGQSEGKSYYQNVSEISQMFYRYLLDEKHIKKQNIILRGYSIGGAVAIDLASKVEFSKLIITSSFTSRYDMSQKMLGFVAQRFLFLPNTFVSVEKIKNIKEPTLIMHGNQDKLIPFFMGQKNFENAGAVKKTFMEIDKSGHNGILKNYGERIKTVVKDFLIDNVEDNPKVEIGE